MEKQLKYLNRKMDILIALVTLFIKYSFLDQPNAVDAVLAQLNKDLEEIHKTSFIGQE